MVELDDICFQDAALEAGLFQRLPRVTVYTVKMRTKLADGQAP